MPKFGGSVARLCPIVHCGQDIAQSTAHKGETVMPAQNAPHHLTYSIATSSHPGGEGRKGFFDAPEKGLGWGGAHIPDSMLAALKTDP